MGRRSVASVGSFFDSVGEFFSNLARVDWLVLLLGLLFFGIYLALRSRAWFNILPRGLSRTSRSSGAGSGAPTWPPTASTTSCPPAAAT